MKIKHFLIEGYCDGKNETEYPCKGTLECGVYCFQCPRFSYTECPNEIAVSGNNGIIESELFPKPDNVFTNPLVIMLGIAISFLYYNKN